MHMRHLFAMSLISFACTTSVFAAKPVDLSHQSASFIQSLTATRGVATVSGVKEISRDVDFNNTTHIRVQQTYAGYPVWGGDAVVHVPQGGNPSITNLSEHSTMNGVMFQGLNADLAAVPSYVFGAGQANKALVHAIQLYQQKSGITKYDTINAKKNLMVYVDKDNKAHWTFLVSFVAAEENGAPAVPTYILDAVTFNVYESWNDLQTVSTLTQGGGFGGNPKLGKIVYDGQGTDKPALDIVRDDAKNLCYLKNKDVVVKDDTKTSGPFSSSPLARFKCDKVDDQHAKLYWDGDLDAKNGAYSPANDALYIGKIIKSMYKAWYHIPVLSVFGQPMKLVMHVHAKDMMGQQMDNAYFLSLTQQMYYGDGVSLFYPLTSLGVGAHEISHGFTAQHSNLAYEKQSGGLNESFSDMAAQAAEYYSTNGAHNSWQIGPEIMKEDRAIRYMDNPRKDGKSIDNMKDYADTLNVHYSSGIFNKAFYLLATSKGWNTRKAFNVMVKANMNYWTSTTTFAQAACGVMSAAKDYKYKTNAVIKAMNGVGLDVSTC